MPRVADPELRERILKAAGTLFYEKGIRAVGMNEIIRQAGCGKNAVYSYFPSKSDLVAEYLTRFVEGREATATAAAAKGGDDPVAQILAIVDETVQRLRAANSRGCAVRNFLIEYTDEDDAAAQISRDFLRRTHRDLLRRVTATGVDDPRAVTEQISLVLEGALLGRLTRTTQQSCRSAGRADGPAAAGELALNQ